MNKANYIKVLNHIKAHPEEWDQEAWCGTACCFAGHAQKFAGKIPEGHSASDAARKFLGIGIRQADWLFSQHRTMKDFEYFLKIKGELSEYALLKEIF